MKAVVLTDGPRFEPNHSDPQPAEGECLVRVHLAGICGTDLHLLRGYMGFRGIPGHEMVGTVVSGAPAWRGRRVVCEINCVCGRCDMCQAGLSNHCRQRTVMGIHGRDGCFAELVAVPERNLHAVPDALADDEAVFTEPLAAALQVLAQCPVDRRTSVRVLGAGRLGLLVAQAFKPTGCRLTVVARHPRKRQLCEQLGVQALALDDTPRGNDHDVVIECSGSPEGLALAMQMVRPRGTIVLKSTCPPDGAINLSPLVVNEIRLLGSRCGPFPEALAALARRAFEVRSLISREYPIDHALAALHEAASPGTVKVLLRMSPRSS